MIILFSPTDFHSNIHDPGELAKQQQIEPRKSFARRFPASPESKSHRLMPKISGSARMAVMGKFKWRIIDEHSIP